MHHEYIDGSLCVHCGLPPERADKAGCPVNRYGEPARRACEAIGLEYVDFNTRDMYANYRNPVTKGFCERLHWKQVESILALVEKAKGAK